MKNLAKKIAVAICVLAVLFSGCSNDVGGSLSNTNKLALLQYQKNNSGSNTTLSELKVIATSEDDVVQFGESRTILPEALQASELTFFLWGEDVINGKIVNQTDSLYKPHTVEFAANDNKTGTVAVDLAISNYKMFLAAVMNTDASDVQTAVDGAASDDVAIAAVMAKSVLYARADVDLRYNETVKFYLSPTNIEGTGTVNLNLRTVNGTTDGSEYWNDPGYAYTICIKDFNGNIIDDTSGTTTAVTVNDKTSGSYVWNDGTNGIDKTYVNYTKVVPSGVYNLFVYFHSNDTIAATEAAGGMIWTFVDRLIVLPNQSTTKSTTHSNAGLDGSDNITTTVADIEKWLVDIPNPIGSKPAAPANLRVGYNNLMNDDAGYYLATFEWDVMDDNAEYYILQLMDVTGLTDATLSGLTDDTLSRLSSFNETYVNPTTKELEVTAAGNMRLDELGTNKVPLAWSNLGAESGVKMESFDKSVSNKSDFELDVKYAGGGLYAQSNKLALWVPLGHVFTARLASYNRACGTPITFDADNGSSVLTSKLEWIYVTEKSLTETELENISTTKNAASGKDDGVFSPVKWSDNDTIDGDEPLAINRFRVTYNLNDGNFISVNATGVLTGTGDVTSAIPLINSTKDAIRVYGNITTNGFALLDPSIYNYASTNYASLFKGSMSWRAWLDGSVAGDKFAAIDWLTNGKKLKVDANGLPVDSAGTARVYDEDTFEYVDADLTVDNDEDWFVRSNKGIINVTGAAGFVSVATTKLATYKQYSSDKTSVYTNKNLWVMAPSSKKTDTYKSFRNLDLFAYYAEDSASGIIYQVADFVPQQRNIRVFKTPGVATSYSGQLTNTSVPVETREVPGSAPAVTYTDGEVMPGTVEIDLSNYKSLTFILAEDALATANQDKWTKASLEIKFSGSVVYNKEMERGTFTPGTSAEGIGTVGSGTANADPLATGAHNDFFFKVATTSMRAGIYDVTYKAYTPNQPNTPLTYKVTYKLIESN